MNNKIKVISGIHKGSTGTLIYINVDNENPIGKIVLDGSKAVVWLYLQEYETFV